MIKLCHDCIDELLRGKTEFEVMAFPDIALTFDRTKTFVSEGVVQLIVQRAGIDFCRTTFGEWQREVKL